MIAVGYSGDPAELPAYLRERELKPRERKSVTEFLSTGRVGVADLVCQMIHFTQFRWLRITSLSQG